MDLSSLWNQGRAAWSNYRNPTMSDEQLFGLMPQTASFDTSSYQPMSMDLYNGVTPNFDGGGSITGFTDFGQASPAQAAWTQFKDSPFKDKVSAMGSTVNALSNAYNAYNTVKLGKEQMAFQKHAWNKEYENQRTLTNASLADRQAARVASSPTAYQSVDSYMKQYGLK